MPRGKISPQKKGAITRQAQKAFTAWNQNRTPLPTYKGKEIWKPSPEEVFVMVWDEDKKDYAKRYYVSNYGSVLSFDKPQNPTCLKSDHDGELYRKVSLNGTKYVHRIMWFSFAADALEKGEPVPDIFGETLTCIDDLKKVAQSDDHEQFDVHHKNENPEFNYLANLVLLPQTIHLQVFKNLDDKNVISTIEALRNIPFENYYKDRAIVIYKGTIATTTTEEYKTAFQNLTILYTVQEMREALNDRIAKLKEEHGESFFDTTKYIKIKHYTGAWYVYAVTNGKKPRTFTEEKALQLIANGEVLE